MRAIVLSASVVAAALFAGPASAHGCHHGWQQSAQDGWHSHGVRCAARQGIGLSRKARPQGRRPA